MKSNPLRDKFIQTVKPLLDEQGIHLDPLDLKKKLEEDIGPMTFQETAEFIEASLRSPKTYEETLDFLRKLQKEREGKSGTLLPNDLLLEGSSMLPSTPLRRKSSFRESSVETQVIRREKG